MNETSTELQSVAPAEAEADPDLSTYRVLRLGAPTADGEATWVVLGTITRKYVPLAEDVGEAYGEGLYLLIERDSKYSFLSTYEMRVVAEKRYRLADEYA